MSKKKVLISEELFVQICTYFMLGDGMETSRLIQLENIIRPQLEKKFDALTARREHRREWDTQHVGADTPTRHGRQGRQP